MLARRGISVGRKRVERVMRGAGVQGAFLRKRWRIASTRTDPRAAPALDLVQRVLTADRPNRLWVADATRIPCGQGAFWLAAVRDAFSNRIVGWKTSDRCDTELVLGALEFAVWSRGIRGLSPGLADPDEAENALFAYIDGRYNSQRIQKKLGWRSPDEFEARYHHPVPAGT